MDGPQRELEEKISYEYETFVCNLKLCSKDNIIARSEEIELKRRIMQKLEDILIPEKCSWYLLAEDNVLELLYRLIKDQKRNANLACSIQECLERMPGLRKGGTDMSAKKILIKEMYREYRKKAGKNKAEETIVKLDHDKNVLLAIGDGKEEKA